MINSSFSDGLFFCCDTVILLNANSVQNLQPKIKDELSRILNWILINKLTVNPQKYNAHIISPSLTEEQSHISITLYSSKV